MTASEIPIVVRPRRRFYHVRITFKGMIKVAVLGLLLATITRVAYAEYRNQQTPGWGAESYHYDC
jgi:hypothetical protein